MTCVCALRLAWNATGFGKGFPLISGGTFARVPCCDGLRSIMCRVTQRAVLRCAA